MGGKICCLLYSLLVRKDIFLPPTWHFLKSKKRSYQCARICTMWSFIPGHRQDVSESPWWVVALGYEEECELQKPHFFLLSLGEVRPSSLTQKCLLLLCCSWLYTVHIWHQASLKGTCPFSSQHLATHWHV